MAILMIILRIIHIIGGVFWMGVGIMQVRFVAPTAQALGPDGQKFMANLVRCTRFAAVIGAASGLTLLSGLIMYVLIYPRLQAQPNYGLGITIGGLFGIVAFVIAVAMIGRPTSQMKKLLDEIEAGGGPPAPEQVGQLQAIGATIGKGGTWVVVTRILAMIGMSAAQYLTF